MLRWLVVLSLTACGGPDVFGAPPEPNIPPPDSGTEEDPDAGLPASELRVLRVTPNHGPFVGGTPAVIRGEGFGGADLEDIVVTFGGAMVNPLFLARVDASRLEVIVPAGVPGPADVEVTVGDDIASLPDGYLYDDIYIEPGRGSIGGGTFVRITGSGTGFMDGDEVYLGRWPCMDVVVVSENVIECYTPPGAVGPADVIVVRGDGSETSIDEGFEYYETAGDGLSGGPSEGTVNVTVIDVETDVAVAEAHVFIGDDVSSAAFMGTTDVFGRVTFSGPELEPPLKVHVVRDCYESASFVVFDAQDVTAYVQNLCPPPPSSGTPPDVGGRLPPRQFVAGELIWRGPNEYGPNPWSNVPEAREGWRRVAYVYTTRPCPFDTLRCYNPDPGLYDSRPRVFESPTGELGYPYRIFSRDAALAVYALAGLENPTTTEFVPYVMGIARNVLVGPGEVVDEVDIVMDIPLDHYLDVRLENVPAQPAERGDLTVRADIDLGGEGIIVRSYGGRYLDRITQRLPERPFRFISQPALHGELSDARYRVDAFWSVSEDDAVIILGGRPTPRWHSIKTGIRAVDEEVVLRDFIAIPDSLAPVRGARIDANRTLEWTATGSVEPTFWQVQLNFADPNTGTITPMWSLFVNGDQTTAQLPDVERLPDIADPANQANLLQILAVYIPGLDFNDVSYGDLAEARWRTWSVRYLYIDPLP